jgi:hypothetical protein
MLEHTYPLTTRAAGLHRRRRLTVGIAAAVLLAVSTSRQPVATADHWTNTRDQPTTFLNETWMTDQAGLIGQRPLKQVAIPAAHDAGTYAMYHYWWQRPGVTGFEALSVKENYINQNIDFSTQLRVGIRKFDIRAEWMNLPGTGTFDYFIHHGHGFTDLRLINTFDEFLPWIRTSAHGKEIVFLNISAGQSNADTSGRFADTCQSFKDNFGPLLITPSMIASTFPGRGGLPEITMNELWSLPGSPRVITNWEACTSDGAWPPGTFDGYYASQCHPDPYISLFEEIGGFFAGESRQRPGIIRQIRGALPTRASAREGSDLTFGTENGPPVTGLYDLSVAPTISADCALFLDTLAGGQKPVLDMLVNAWDNLELNARANLNYVNADFVQWREINLVPRVTALNGGPTISADARQDAAGNMTGITFACTAWNRTSTGGPLPAGKTNTVSRLTATGAAAGSIDNSSTLVVNVPASATGTIRAECAETSGAIARMIVDPAVIGRSVWTTGRKAVDAQGFDIQHLTVSGNWQAVDGAAVRVAVGPDGLPWVINNSDQIFRRSSAGAWTLVPGAAKDIGVGADGSVWVTGANGIWYLPPDGASQGVDGAATQVSVGPDGQPWVVNDRGQIFRRGRGATGYADGSWQMLPGSARDIGVGADGSAWIVAADGSIARWTGSDWQQVDGAGERIAVGPDGLPWVVNNEGRIWRRQANGAWVVLPGEATDVAVGTGP